MKRFNLYFTLLIAAIGAYLIVNAGEPVTPEAEIVQTWYNTLCSRQPDFDTLLRLTWHGDLTDEEFQDTIIRYRESGQMNPLCIPVIDHDLIFFQWIPPALNNQVESIKFVAVNVYDSDSNWEPNHILSVRTGIHVVFFKTGAAQVVAGFLGVPLDDAPLQKTTQLFNNDGLDMGTARVTGAITIIPQDETTFVGVQVELQPSRTWGNYTIRLFTDYVQAAGINAAELLPEESRAGFIAASGEGLAANELIEGMVWFQVRGAVGDLRLSFEASQTPWDMRPLPAFVEVQ
jgi:hypothetical protein